MAKATVSDIEFYVNDHITGLVERLNEITTEAETSLLTAKNLLAGILFHLEIRKGAAKEIDPEVIPADIKRLNIIQSRMLDLGIEIDKFLPKK